MARIRTVKPEFFTSDDICNLSLPARLLYIGVWCEADREGRLEWKPGNLKRRYLPDDAVDIHALCKELIDAGLVVPYSEGLAYIPTFGKHQHVNPRESASTLPEPRNTTRQSRDSDASGTRQARDSDAQVGREGKGKEGKEDASARVEAEVSIPLEDGSEHPVTAADIAEFRSAYPKIDPLAEARKARAWCIANPTKQKTRRGVGKFLNGWMDRANKDAAANQPAPTKQRRQL